MDKPISISVGEISKAAKTTVKKVLANHKAAFPKIPDHRIGFFPPHYWFGFVMDATPEVEKAAMSELVSVAVEIKRFTADKVGAKIGAGRPGVMLNDGILTIGFAPPIDVNVIEG
jgi:hypothetical protein